MPFIWLTVHQNLLLAGLYPDPLGNLEHSPDPLVAFKGRKAKGKGRKGVEGRREGKGGEREGDCIHCVGGWRDTNAKEQLLKAKNTTKDFSSVCKPVH